MINLYWKSPQQTRNLVEKGFSFEAELEMFLIAAYNSIAGLN